MTDYKDAIAHVMMNNLRVQGNCLGLTEDLVLALEDFSAGRLPVIVDSVFSGKSAGEFLTRSYTDADRFGKVVYQYS